MAQIQEWGPHIWKILHYHAEYAGGSLLLADEIRAWINLLRRTEGVLACAVCREHYREWLLRHPVEEFLGKDKHVFRETVRRWLWDLHEHVNDKKLVAAGERPSFEDVSRIYKNIPRQEIFQSVQTLKGVLQKAVLHRQVNGLHVTEWFRIVKFLQKINGF